MYQMATGILGFNVPSRVELANKCLKTMSALGSGLQWRFRNKTVVADISSVSAVLDVIVKTAKPIVDIDPSFFSASAATDDCDTLPTITFAIYSKKEESAVRIKVRLPGTLYERVECCREMLSAIIEIWKPLCGYVKSEEQLQKDCSKILKVFPAGYAVYTQSAVSFTTDDREIECLPSNNGTWIRFRESFLRYSSPSCEQLDRLISIAGGIDNRYTMLQW